jgi:hypothetical protein
MATLGVFIALGGSAYAVNTVGSADIIDGEVKAPDIGANAVDSARVRDGTLNTFDVHSFIGDDVIDGTLTGADISNNTVGVNDIGTFGVGSDEVVNDSLLQSDIQANAVTNDEVLNNTLVSADVNDNTLTGADINESTLNMPPSTTATFAGQGNVTLPGNSTFGKVTSKVLPAGNYAIAATANVQVNFGGEPDLRYQRETFCELRNHAGAFIGGARDRRVIRGVDVNTVSLSMNGGTAVPAGGGEVGLYCRFQDFPQPIADGQMMIIRLDGFF